MTPLVVISGFLGAGKTSFLRRLLPRLVEKKIAPLVIVNDYMNAHVDEILLREYSHSIAPISGTCVCCGSRDELMETLAAMDVPKNSVLLLEANGTADTLELLEFLAADKRAARFTLPVQINIVDAIRWQQRHWNNDIESLQARTATFLSLTRRDEADGARWDEVIASLRAMNPSATIADDNAIFDMLLALIEDAAGKGKRRFVPVERNAATHRPGHEEHHFAALEILLPARVNESALRKFLAELPAEVVRAKGVAIFASAPDESVVFQKIEGRGEASFMKLGTAHDVSPVLLLVGPRLPESALRDRIAALA
jgi:G3E family GTPase